MNIAVTERWSEIARICVKTIGHEHRAVLPALSFRAPSGTCDCAVSRGAGRVHGRRRAQKLAKQQERAFEDGCNASRARLVRAALAAELRWPRKHTGEARWRAARPEFSQ